MVCRGVLMLAVWMCAVAELAAAEDQRTTTVGVPARINDLVLPGTQLEVIPLEDRRSPIVTRIVRSFPHGTAYRYDLVYYGLEPGEFDLRDYLRRQDGSSTDDLPEISVDVQPVLPAGQIGPNALDAETAPYLGGYWLAMIIGGVLWVAGLAAILFVGRKPKHEAAAASQRHLTLADRLQPIVEDAIAGKVSQQQQAELERMLVAFWRKRLGLQHMTAASAMGVLREHEQAGPLLRQLEAWLHQPGVAHEVDVAALLEPYRNLPADALNTSPYSAIPVS